MKRFAVFLLFFSFLSVSQAKGYIDSGSVYNRYVGWACIPSSNEVVGIHIYASGVYIGGGNAGLTREFAVRDACGSADSNHGFDISVDVPTSLLDGSVREVQVYSIHANGTTAPLDNGPVRIQFAALPGKQRPQQLGDIVGRNLSYSWGGPLNYFGHIGIWDEANVIEAIGTADAADTLKVTPWEVFSNASDLWPVLSPVVEDLLHRYCHKTICDLDNSVYETRKVGGIRELAAKRAYVSYLIGASYTRTAFYTETRQGTRRLATETCNPFAPPQSCNPPVVEVKPSRGTYRCETFVLHSYASTSMLSGSATVGQEIYTRLFENTEKKNTHWGNQISYLLSTLRVRAPSAVYENLGRWNI